MSKFKFGDAVRLNLGFSEPMWHIGRITKVYEGKCRNRYEISGVDPRYIIIDRDLELVPIAHKVALSKEDKKKVIML